jgi:hypothetical protein
MCRLAKSAKRPFCCKVLCHNLCVLVQSMYERGIVPTFWAGAVTAWQTGRGRYRTCPQKRPFAPQRQCAGAGTLVAVAPLTGTLV